MSKLFNIIFIISIFFTLLFPNFVQATNIDMNLSPDNSITTVPQTYTSSGSLVSSLNSLPEAELGLTNILSILLIVIGVLLILLSIAILIRLKH